MSAKRKVTSGTLGTAETSTTVQIFVSYAHDNKVWFRRLEPVLQFPDTCVVHVWHDTKLEAGHRWDDEIKAALKSMDIFLCLVSFEFLQSWYIRNVELKEALERANRKEVEILPVLLYDVNLREEHPDLYPFNPLPAWGQCWHNLCGAHGDYQAAHQLIRTGLREAIRRVHSRKDR